MSKTATQKCERFTVERFTLVGNPPPYAILKLKSETQRGVRIGVRITGLSQDEEMLKINGVNRSSGVPLFGELQLKTRSGWISYR